MSFSIVTILGLQAAGLNYFGKAMDTNVQAQITQGLMGTVRQTDFSLLSQLNGTKRYYDNQGLEVTDSAEIAARRYIYEADLAVETGKGLPSSLTPDDPATAPASLATIKATITSQKSPQVKFEFSTLVTDNGL